MENINFITEEESFKIQLDDTLIFKDKNGNIMISEDSQNTYIVTRQIPNDKNKKS